jgi:hypothetical protein
LIGSRDKKRKSLRNTAVYYRQSMAYIQAFDGSSRLLVPPVIETTMDPVITEKIDTNTHNKVQTYIIHTLQ